MLKRLILLTALAAGLALGAGPVYELRTYTAPEGKLDALIARFKDHTVRIFNKHKMESVGYWVPQEPKNTLIYILKFPSKEAGEQAWKDFQADPEWQKVQKESEVNGRLATKVERIWMDPTDFSKLK